MTREQWSSNGYTRPVAETTARKGPSYGFFRSLGAFAFGLRNVVTVVRWLGTALAFVSLAVISLTTIPLVVPFSTRLLAAAFRLTGAGTVLSSRTLISRGSLRTSFRVSGVRVCVGISAGIAPRACEARLANSSDGVPSLTRVVGVRVSALEQSRRGLLHATNRHGGVEIAGPTAADGIAHG